jgi:hypothetical protein
MDILNFSYDLEDEMPICSLHIFNDEEQKWFKISHVDFTCIFDAYIAYILSQP